MKEKGFSVMELLGVVACLLVLFVALFGVFGINISSGQRVGTLQKLSTKGVVFKTVEGQLALEGVSLRSDLSVWEFSVKDPAVAQQLNNYLGKKVKLTYDQKIINWPRSTTYNVSKVEE